MWVMRRSEVNRSTRSWAISKPYIVPTHPNAKKTDYDKMGKEIREKLKRGKKR